MAKAGTVTCTYSGGPGNEHRALTALRAAGFDATAIAGWTDENHPGPTDSWIELASFRGPAGQQPELQEAVLKESAAILEPLGYSLRAHGVVVGGTEDYRLLLHRPTGRVLLRGWLGGAEDAIGEWSQRFGLPASDLEIVHETPELLAADTIARQAHQRLRRAFRAQETVLTAALHQARAENDHAGAKGTRVEASVREFLRRHLPTKYTVGEGELIDVRGLRSRQVDVIINTDDQPFVVPEGGPGQFLLDGVAACAEVKAQLGTKELDDLVSKGDHLRRLRYHYTAGDERYAAPSDGDRFYRSPPYFAFAFETNLSPERILDRLQSATEQSTATEEYALPPVDAIFTLDKGVAINYGDGTGALQMRSILGESHPGWLWHPPGDALVHLFLWLHAVMPRVHRRSSIALPYLSPLGIGWDSLADGA